MPRALSDDRFLQLGVGEVKTGSEKKRRKLGTTMYKKTGRGLTLSQKDWIEWGEVLLNKTAPTF